MNRFRGGMFLFETLEMKSQCVSHCTDKGAHPILWYTIQWCESAGWNLNQVVLVCGKRGVSVDNVPIIQNGPAISCSLGKFALIQYKRLIFWAYLMMLHTNIRRHSNSYHVWCTDGGSEACDRKHTVTFIKQTCAAMLVRLQRKACKRRPMDWGESAYG